MTFLEYLCRMAQDPITYQIFALRMTPKKGDKRASSKRWWLCGVHLRNHLNKTKLVWEPYITENEAALKHACNLGRIIDVKSIDHVSCRACRKASWKK